MTTVWRQGAVRASGPGVGSRPDPVLYERFLHNPGWGARLDAPMMSQVNDDWNELDANGQPVTPNWDRTRTFAQDRFGNVIAVTDNGLQRAVVRISYDQLGKPVLDSDYVGADLDENGGVDGDDLAKFFLEFEAGSEVADLDQNGGIDGDDLALFFQWFEAGFMGDHELNDQRFLYRGYWWDDKLEMYHVRNRVYDPRRMIWLQRDPLGQLAGPDEYAYVFGEPRDGYDPMGLWFEQTATDWVNRDWAVTRAAGYMLGMAGGAGEQAVDQVGHIANGAVKAGKEVGLIAHDLAMTQYDPLGLHHRSKSQLFKTFDQGGTWSELYTDGAWVGGRVFISGVTLGGYDVVENTVNYFIDGDEQALGEGMGGIAASNLAGAAAEGLLQAARGASALDDAAKAAGSAGDDAARTTGNGCPDSPSSSTRTTNVNGSAPSDGPSKVYDRPKFRKGIRESVWESAADADGVVRDPLTSRVLKYDEPWDVGHETGYEFRKHQQSARRRGLTREQFLDEYNHPDTYSHYRPELPKSNRSHATEAADDVYFGP